MISAPVYGEGVIKIASPVRVIRGGLVILGGGRTESVADGNGSGVRGMGTGVLLGTGVDGAVGVGGGAEGVSVIVGGKAVSVGRTTWVAVGGIDVGVLTTGGTVGGAAVGGTLVQVAWGGGGVGER